MFRTIGFFLLLIVNIAAFSQTGIISGKVVDAQTSDVIVGASVFLANATKGTQTDLAGKFSLTNIKAGQYDLIVTYIGYLTNSYHVTVNNDSQDLQIKMEKRVITLKEVVIGPDKNWQQNYERFKRDFIGNSENALNCKITNPKVLSLFYDRNDQVLEASSDEFLVIENKALGYRLKYLLSKFNREYKTGMLYYEGQTLFENLQGSKSQIKRWKKNRDEAYYGSSMHFFRSLAQNRAKEDGFIIHTLTRINNTARLPDSLIQAKIKTFSNAARTSSPNDSLNYWMRQARVPRILQVLHKDSLSAYDIIKQTQVPNLFALSFKDNLYVVYTQKHILTYFSTTYRTQEIADYPVSIITLKTPYALFDTNGIIANPKSTVYEGEWTQGVADLLPYDYEPGGE